MASGLGAARVSVLLPSVRIPTNALPVVGFVYPAVVSIPPVVWAWLAATIVVTAVLAFMAGVRYERGASRRALGRARKHLSRLLGVVFESLESAQQACQLLQQFPNASLTARQMEQLESRQSQLLDTVTRIVENQQKQAESASARAQGRSGRVKNGVGAGLPASESGLDDPAVAPADFSVEWQREPGDKKTSLPDRSSFDASLEGMLQAGDEATGFSGLLLIKVDKFDQLRQRYGTQEAAAFLRKLAGVVIRTARDQDLLCRFAEDTIALLMPSILPEAGRSLAHRIRQSVRHSHFQLEENGAEVLVTASFGYAASPPGDTAEHILSRAGNALEKSQRLGRNQLHVHDGHTVAHCLAG